MCIKVSIYYIKSILYYKVLIWVYLCYIFAFKVSSDEQFVRRPRPLPEPSNVDERTLYVVSSAHALTTTLCSYF